MSVIPIKPDDAILVIISLLKLFNSDIVQKAITQFQAEEVSRKNIEDIAPNDEYSK